MKKTALSKFFAAGDELLNTAFGKEECVIIVHAKKGKMTHAVRGKSVICAAALAQIAKQDDNFFRLMKSVVEYITEEKTNK